MTVRRRLACRRDPVGRRPHPPHARDRHAATDPIQGQLAAVQMRVGDAGRAAAWFSNLFGWTFTEAPRGSLRWSHAWADLTERPWALAITDAASAPKVRLGFEVADPDEALMRATSLGGAVGARPGGERRPGPAVGLLRPVGCARRPGTRAERWGSSSPWSAIPRGLRPSTAPCSATASTRSAPRIAGGPAARRSGSSMTSWADVSNQAPSPISRCSSACASGGAQAPCPPARRGCRGGVAMGPYEVCDCRDDQDAPPPLARSRSLGRRARCARDRRVPPGEPRLGIADEGQGVRPHHLRLLVAQQQVPAVGVVGGCGRRAGQARGGGFEAGLGMIWSCWP